MGRMKKLSKKPTAKQKAHIVALNVRKWDKENDEPHKAVIHPKPQAEEPRTTLLADTKKKLANTQRKARHLLTQQKLLRDSINGLKAEVNGVTKDNKRLEKEASLLQSDMQELHGQIESEKTKASEMRNKLHAMRSETRKYKKRLARAATIKERVAKRAALMPSAFKMMHGRTYSIQTRRLARSMVASGCARSKVGLLISQIGNTFGVDVPRSMSRRTVSRTMLEGYVAAKGQIAYEISRSKSLTMSADSTGNKGENFESSHLAIRTANYKSGLDIDPNSVPRLRLLALDSTVDHTAATSVANFDKRIAEAFDIFNRSPHAARLGRTLGVRDFYRILMGMNGDHASKEKNTAKGMEERKLRAGYEDLGEDALLAKSVGDLVVYLSAWNQKKIAEAGGIDAWNQLSPLEQAERDKTLMSEILQTLGKEEYDQLAPTERHQIASFIWAGCCMHKNSNSFEAGNTEMMLEWAKLGVPGPMLLANKSNAAALRRILVPERPHEAQWTEEEKRAFENSTRGGVKTTALAGTILRNKDDKKGEGKKHSNYFKEKVSQSYTRFPDTSNTRFGSHGDAAADLVRYLDHYITYFDVIRQSKHNATFNHLELNVSRVLMDEPTITELCAIILYQQAVGKPYVRVVRKPGQKSDNVLDLGPLHEMIQEFIEKVIDEPGILVSPDASYIEGSFDGKEWDDPAAMEAVFELIPNLPHIVPLTVAFFRGSLPTWKWFSAEFAPGGLIDQASAEEKHLAWMPATNDVNEGALGAYRVIIRGKPSMTLHQYNALAMYRHNDTQDFMDAVLVEEDHMFLMREARRIDADGLEKKRRQELVDFRVEVARLRREKEEGKRQKAIDDVDRLSRVVLISRMEDIYDLTVVKLGDQIDAFRFRGLPDVPNKNNFRIKAERQAALKEIFERYTSHVAEHSPLMATPHSLPVIQAIDGWETREEAETEE